MGRLLLVASLAGACGDDDGRGLGEAAADYVCTRILRCCTLEEARSAGTSALPPSVEDYAGCRIAYRTAIDGYVLPAIGDSQALGRAAFDEAGFRRCLLRVRDGACDGTVPDVTACYDEAIAGLVPDGDACSRDYECSSGYCADPGLCAARAAQGEPCDDDDHCAGGLFCDVVCLETQRDGSPCGRDEECASAVCLAAGQCGVACDGDGVGLGPPPDPTLESAGARAAIAVCTKIFGCCDSAERAEIAGVETQLECQGLLAFILAQGLPRYHNAVRDGRAALDALAVETCLSAYEAQDCGAFAEAGIELPLACPWLIGRVALGGECELNQECATGYCEGVGGGTPGTCQARPSQGEACAPYGCAETLYCDGTCQPHVGLGEICSSDDACASGTCWDDGSGTRRCTLICDGT